MFLFFYYPVLFLYLEYCFEKLWLELIYHLASNPNRVYTRDQLLDEVWGYEYEGDTRTVDSHVARLRTKLGEWGVNHIKTIYGTGYKIQL